MALAAGASRVLRARTAVLARMPFPERMDRLGGPAEEAGTACLGREVYKVSAASPAVLAGPACLVSPASAESPALAEETATRASQASLVSEARSGVGALWDIVD